MKTYFQIMLLNCLRIHFDSFGYIFALQQSNFFFSKIILPLFLSQRALTFPSRVRCVLFLLKIGKVKIVVLN
jgi:hypothetical protein